MEFEYAVESILALNTVLLGWLHSRQNKMEISLEERVHRDDLKDVKESLRNNTEVIGELKEELAEWRGLLKGLLRKNDSENF